MKEEKPFRFAVTVMNDKGKPMIVDYESLEKSVDSFIDETDPMMFFLIGMKLVKRFFTVTDLGTTSKNILHWKNEGLLLDNPTTEGKWARFNFIDFVWIQIIKELRELNVPLETIKKVKTGLIDPEQHKSYDALLKEAKADKDYRKANEEQHELIADFFFNMSLAQTFNNLISECIAFRINAQVVIFSDGDAYFYKDSENNLFKTLDEDNVLSVDELRSRTHIKISIAEIIKRYIISDKVTFKIHDLKLLRPEEQQLLELIQKNDVAELTVKVDNKNIDLIKYKQVYNSVDVASRLMDHIAKHGFQDINVKTKNGTIVQFSKTTSIKTKK